MRVFLMSFLLLFATLAPAVEYYVVGEVFTQTWCGYCPDARSGLRDLAGLEDHLVPLMWNGGTNEETCPTSPNYSARASMYGVNGIPHTVFGGTVEEVGGGTDMLPYYQADFDEVADYDSPLEIGLGFGINNNGQLAITANIEVAHNITASDVKLMWIISQDYSDEYNCVVRRYAQEDFTLTTEGQVGNYSHAFDMDADWNLEDLKAVVIVQSTSGNLQILQAAQSGNTTLTASFNSNVQTGPADLNIEFNDMSIPASEITAWDWDLNGDGTIDSHEANPSWVYTEPGSYDVSLTVYVGPDSSASITLTDYITVTDNSAISGTVNGTWRADNGVYHLAGDIQVPAGYTLEIEPGTEIRTANDSQIYVAGELLANGEANNLIQMIPEDGVTWKGIRFQNGTDQCVLNYCEIAGVSESAIRIEATPVDITNCYIHGNNTEGLAPIDLTSATDVLIQGNLIAGNSSLAAAGAIGMITSTPDIRNNLVVNNSGFACGAFSIKTTSYPMITNNTIANNLCTGNANCDIFHYNAYSTMVNNIVWGQATNEIKALQSTIEVSYCDVSSGYDGTGNIQSDPLFVNPSTTNGIEGFLATNVWTLHSGSPCVDTGNPSEEFNDVEDPANPGYALAPAMGTVHSDMGAFGGDGNSYWTVDNDEPGTIPETSVLKVTVAPNPFNPNTTIAYSVPQAGKVNVTVYNVKGQQVATLVSETKTPGDYQVRWNGDDSNGHKVGSGIYYVMATAGNDRYTVVKKMILLK